MRLWRIAQRKHAFDKLCAGAAQHGGRWNPIGTPALYCATSIALCSLEKFVHLNTGVMPPLVLVAVDIPDGLDLYTPDSTALPAGWDTLPTSSSAQAFGAAWLAGGQSLGMLVPSVLVHEELNMVLNPSHQDYARVALGIVRPFVFDQRMFKTSELSTSASSVL